jgi:hypothetical protein
VSVVIFLGLFPIRFDRTSTRARETTANDDG